MQAKTKYQDKCRLIKGDEVMVVAGGNRGQSGKIDRVDRKTHRVFISGINIAKRHTRPGGMNEEGGIVDKVMGIHWSNVMLIDPKTKKPTRIGYKAEGGKRQRVAKGSGTVLS